MANLARLRHTFNGYEARIVWRPSVTILKTKDVTAKRNAFRNRQTNDVTLLNKDIVTVTVCQSL